MELMFLFNSDGEVMLLPVQGNKDEFVENVKQMIREQDIIGAVHIAEAWSRFGHVKDHVTKQIILGEMGVSDLRPEDKSEALLVAVQSRDGKSSCWIDAIIRNKENGSVGLGDACELNEVGGRLGGLFEFE